MAKGRVFLVDDDPSVRKALQSLIGAAGFDVESFLCVNLKAEHKKAQPGYQAIEGRQIPAVELAGGSGTARVIAGELAGTGVPRAPSRRSTSSTFEWSREPEPRSRCPTAGPPRSWSCAARSA